MGYTLGSAGAGEGRNPRGAGKKRAPRRRSPNAPAEPIVSDPKSIPKRPALVNTERALTNRLQQGLASPYSTRGPLSAGEMHGRLNVDATDVWRRDPHSLATGPTGAKDVIMTMYEDATRQATEALMAAPVPRARPVTPPSRRVMRITPSRSLSWDPEKGPDTATVKVRFDPSIMTKADTSAEVRPGDTSPRIKATKEEKAEARKAYNKKKAAYNKKKASPEAKKDKEFNSNIEYQ